MSIFNWLRGRGKPKPHAARPGESAVAAPQTSEVDGIAKLVMLAEAAGKVNMETLRAEARAHNDGEAFWGLKELNEGRQRCPKLRHENCRGVAAFGSCVVLTESVN